MFNFSFASEEAVLIRLGGETVTLSSETEEKKIESTTRINLSLQEADIHHAIRLIADVSELNFVISDSVSGTISVELVDVPWTDALAVILMTKSLVAQPIGEVMFVQPSSPTP